MTLGRVPDSSGVDEIKRIEVLIPRGATVSTDCTYNPPRQPLKSTIPAFCELILRFTSNLSFEEVAGKDMTWMLREIVGKIQDKDPNSPFKR